MLNKDEGTMKKEYIAPETEVVALQSQGMLANSNIPLNDPTETVEEQW